MELVDVDVLFAGLQAPDSPRSGGNYNDNYDQDCETLRNRSMTIHGFLNPSRTTKI